MSWAEEVRRLDADTSESAGRAFARGEHPGFFAFVVRPTIGALRSLTGAGSGGLLRRVVLAGYRELVHAAKLWDLERRWRLREIVAFRDGRFEVTARREWRRVVNIYLQNELVGEPRPGGRGGILRVATENGPVIVRELRRGGAMQRLGSHFVGFGSRAAREFHLLLLARRRALPVPEPVAAITERVLPFLYRGRLLTAEMTGAVSLWEAARAERRDAVWAQVGKDLRVAHEAGLYHADLNLGNVLVLPGDRPATAFVDLDRARISPRPLPEWLRRRNLARLRRSARKLDPTGATVTDADLEALERACRGDAPR